MKINGDGIKPETENDVFTPTESNVIAPDLVTLYGRNRPLVYAHDITCHGRGAFSAVVVRQLLMK